MDLTSSVTNVTSGTIHNAKDCQKATCQIKTLLTSVKNATGNKECICSISNFVFL